MSGRVVWFRDGKKVTGYRKTDRRQSPARKLPPWHLSFILPDNMSVSPKSLSGLISVKAGPRGWIEIVGRRDWVISQAGALMHRIRPHWRGVILARLTRDNEPGPTLSGPLHRGDDRVIEIKITGEAPVMTDGQSMRQLELAMTVGW